MAQLIELSPEEKRLARNYEINLSSHNINNATPIEVANLVNQHLDDTFHLYRYSENDGSLHNGDVVRIDTRDEVKAGVNLTLASEEIANKILARGAVAVVFSRDRDLVPTEIFAHNGA